MSILFWRWMLSPKLHHCPSRARILSQWPLANLEPAHPNAQLDAAAFALQSGPISYTSAPGIVSLPIRIARHYLETYSVEVDPARIFATTGSSAGFVLAFLSSFDVGARIAIPSPGYPAYRNIIKALSMVPVEIETNDDSRWTLNADLLEQANAQEKIDGLLFANPNNPNGTMIARRGFRQLMEKSHELGIRFISDEIYHGLTYEIEETCALEISDDVIIINSFSKYYCMTGWRIGWMIVPENMIRTIDRLQQNLFICAPEISQIAGGGGLLMANRRWRRFVRGMLITDSCFSTVCQKLA